MFKKLLTAWRLLPNIGIKAGMSDMQLAKTRIFNYLVLTILLVQLMLLVRELATYDKVGIIMISSFCIISTSFLILHHYFGLDIAGGAINVFYPLVMALYLLMVGDGEGIEYSFFVFMLTAVIFQRKQAFRLFLIVYNILLFVFSSLYLEQNDTLIQRSSEEQSDYLVLFVAASICFAFVIYVFNQALENYDQKSLDLINSLQNQNTKLSTTNEELERFSYIASHDLKTPLRNIVSFLGLMEKRLKQGREDELEEYFSIVKTNARNMYTLIEETLEYSKLGQQEWKMEIVDLNQIIAKIKEQLMLSADDTVIIDSDFLPTIRGDNFYLYKLFFNLIENGIKYNEQTEKNVCVQFERREKTYLFCFQDNGIGIDPEYFDQIFIMFKRLHTKDKYQGTGIGLSMCKKIIETMSGKIWLESEPGEGSTFYILLPIESIQLREQDPAQS